MTELRRSHTNAALPQSSSPVSESSVAESVNQDHASEVVSADQLISQMTRQREILQQIAKHLPEQLQAAQKSDDQRLGELIEQRRRLIVELGRIDQSLLPTRRFLASRDPRAPWRSHPLADVRPQVEALAEDMLKIKSRIEQCDAECQRLLSSQRKQNDQQRSRMQQGARAAAAYRQGATQPGGLGFSSQSFYSGGTA